MAVLTMDHSTRRKAGDRKPDLLAAGSKDWAGCLLVRNPAGFLTKGLPLTAPSALGVRNKLWTLRPAIMVPVQSNAAPEYSASIILAGLT